MVVPQLEIHVDGKGSTFRVAERCYLQLSIASTSTDQSKAFQEVQNTLAHITTTIRALAPKAEDGRPHDDAAVTAFTVTPLSTVSRYQLNTQYRPLTAEPKEYTVQASAEVIFRGMAQLADVSSELARMPHLSIFGVEWRLTEATRGRLEREARLKAIADAVQKAQDYAGVVGRRVVAVEVIDQPVPSGLGLHRTAQAQMQMQMQMQQQQMQQQSMQQSNPQFGSNAAAAASEGLLLEPKTITVSACVKAKFVSYDEGGDEMETVH
ncbi:hypothetical protein QBC42DRAFT_262304 [Cladorrhinum samala]|uniref:Uncharacterized protein n=1 Tax=Cladorrhinum samala TaxID=585594 RepID=A0AAV9HXB1_9PEZI|nr:hypothetical protein QBC42DRAFT_262304 [Cladorrhinum samala]